MRGVNKCDESVLASLKMRDAREDSVVLATKNNQH